MTRLLLALITTLPLTACSLDQITGTGPSDEERTERLALLQEIGAEPGCVPVFRVVKCVDGQPVDWSM